MRLSRKILFASFLFIGFLTMNLQISSADTKIIGFTTAKANEGYGCYFTPPGDTDKASDERRYYFIEDENENAIMNIGGRDVQLKNDSSSEVKGNSSKFVWIYSAKNVKATFNLTKIGGADDGEEGSSSFNATITVTAGGKKQSVTAKGFCGG